MLVIISLQRSIVAKLRLIWFIKVELIFIFYFDESAAKSKRLYYDVVHI